jgi:hypothetical protein
MCKVKQLKPNYLNIKINGQKPQDKKTTTNAIRIRINQEIKFPYRKKQHLSQRLYYLHLESAHQYNEQQGSDTNSLYELTSTASILPRNP